MALSSTSFDRHRPSTQNASVASPACDAASSSAAHSAGRPRSEHFIPLRRADLVELVCRQPELGREEADGVRRLAHLVSATFHFRFHAALEDLKAAYAPFDPDSDVPLTEPLSTDDDARRLDDLFARFTALMERANFIRLTRNDVLAALGAMSAWGVRVDVDLDVFERLEVFARGEGELERPHRSWRTRFRTLQVSVPVYRRLAVMFRLRPHKRLGRWTDAHTVFLKLFKDIPRQDLEMLLPGSRVRMSRFDQMRVALPTVSGLAITGWKVVQGALTLALAGAAGIVAFLALVGGALGYAGRSLFGYLRTKEKYQHHLTRSLYYQNLDNNAGVLHRLVDEAEEQECREAILAWFLLWRRAGPDGWPADELDRAAEEFLRGQARLSVDFEVRDALAKLADLRIVEETSAGRFRAVPLDAALQALDLAWDGLFAHSGRGAALGHPSPAQPDPGRGGARG
jgi:hypothetical protein